MFRKVPLSVLLAVIVLAPIAHSVVTPIAKLTMNENKYEKFGSVFFPFTFLKPRLYVFCELGKDATGRCVQGVVSDLISVTNNQAGEGVVSMLSESQEGSLVVPPDFPLPPSGSPIIFLKETGAGQ